MDFRSPDGYRQYAGVLRTADRLVVGLDFDGTLAPIVDDPERAVIHPDAPAVLRDVAESVLAVAVVTGRPARQVLALGDLEEVGKQLGQAGSLQVLGQYGNELWSSRDRQVVSPEPPQGLATLAGELPGILLRHDADAAWVEDKGLALAVHTRRMTDPQKSFDRLLGPLTEAARSHGLSVEPGRMVIEVRAPGMDKGAAVRRLADELDAGGFVFVGDDLGDLEAFRAVRELRASGMPGLLVCSGSEEQQALVALSDVVVDGPDGVLGFLRQLVTDIAQL
ncbi:MAG: trehalose-phosphatase [Marmoricola sp.]